MNIILIIDDYENVRTYLRVALVKEGYMVMEASDGAQGLALCRDNPIAVVITDILMPGKEGIATIFELRRDFPDVKIIAMSGGGFIGSKDCLTWAKRAGAMRAFAKSFEIGEMLDAVEQLCSQGVLRSRVMNGKG